MTSHTMNILGRTVGSGLDPIRGGADNYFFDPTATPAPVFDRGVVWGGITKACPDWFFGDSSGICNAGTGDPIDVTPVGFYIIVRSIKIWPHAGEPAGSLAIRNWSDRPALRETRFKVAVVDGVPLSFEFGIEGFATDTLPFVQLTVPASAEIVYELVQGRFP
jgi:hypothetical protein